MRRSLTALALFAALSFAWLGSPALADPATAPQPAAVELDPTLGIAHHRPVFGGACKSCPWGSMADIVKAALAPYGYDVQVCYHCFMADAPRIVADARTPPPWSDHMGGGVIPDSYIPRPPNGQVELGAVSDQFLIAAYHGTGAYARDGPRPQLRLLANIDSPLFLIVAVNKASGLTDLAQLKDHKKKAR